MILRFKAALRIAALFLLIATTPALAQLGDPPAAEIEREDFFREGIAPVSKPAAYDVTVVYFYDYQCPACRQYTPGVEKALREDRRVRVIYRDVPIFGARSEQAARLAIASRYQGRHDAFHHALMTQKLPLDEPAIRAAADKAGVDWARLQKDAAAHSSQIAAQVARNLALHDAAGIAGTPAFIVNDSLADGALDFKGLKDEIADARAKIAKPETAPAPETSLDEPAEAVTIEMVGNEVVAVADENAAPLFNPSASPEATRMTGEPAKGPARWSVFVGISAALAVIAALLLLRRRRAA